MLRDAIKIHRLKDYINISNTEVKISIFITIILLFIADNIQLYSNFDLFRTALQNITIYIAAGLLGMIGIILTGIALMIGILDKMFIEEIRQKNEKLIEEIMSCFVFLVFNLGIGVIVFFFDHLILFMKINMIKNIFYLIFAIHIYYFTFILFYTIDLTAKSIDLYLIKNFTSIQEIKSNDIDRYVEKIKVEYLMRNCKSMENSYDEFFEDIDEIIDDLNDSVNDITKAKLKKVFRDIYKN